MANSVAPRQLNRPTKFRLQLPRTYELWDLIPDPTSPNAYFQNTIEEYIGQSAHVKQIYARWEKDLQGLDAEAWGYLKNEASPYLIRRDPRRGWQQLFDILNQARAFNHLKFIGYSTVRFVPRADEKKKRTPDLEGTLGRDRALCEVKTINISQDEAEARAKSTVRSIATELNNGFFGKLRFDITEAGSQLRAYDPDWLARHYVYFNLCFDDFLGEYKERYFRQIDEYLSDNLISDLDLIFHNEPTPFYKELTMTSAMVVNSCQSM